MTTTLSVSPSGERKIAYALQYEVAPVEETHQGYYLNVYFTSRDELDYVPEGGRLLIRTTKDNVISLTDCGEESFREFDSELNLKNTSYRSTRYYDDKSNSYLYNVHAKYPISEEDLTQLREEGAIKIRIETIRDFFECNYKDDPKKKNKTAEVISQLYNVIVKELDIYSGL